MGYEHVLGKQDPNGFSDADRAEMAAYLNRLRHLCWQGAWLLIPDAEMCAARANTLESTGDINFELNSWLAASIADPGAEPSAAQAYLAAYTLPVSLAPRCLDTILRILHSTRFEEEVRRDLGE